MLFVKELIWSKLEVIKGVQEFKTSQPFQGDICKVSFGKLEREIKELSGNLLEMKRVQSKTYFETNILKERVLNLKTEVEKITFELMVNRKMTRKD